MIKIAPWALALGLLLVGVGAARCVGAAPEDPGRFPGVEDAMSVGGLAVMVLGASRRRLGGRERAA